MEISIVVPVYGCEKCLETLTERLTDSLNKIVSQFEIIYVVDASPDNSWHVVTQQSKRNSRIKGILFSRNFGQHAAILAGLNEAKGSWIVVMDCDLQDKPEEIINLYQKALDGYDLVLAQRQIRQDTLLKRTTSKLFYAFFSYMTETKQDPSVANFGIYHQKVIHAVLEMGDFVRFFPANISWVGFKKTYLQVEHNARFEGETSYNFKSLFRLARNVILSFSDKPLRLAVRLGVYISIFSVFFAIITIARFLLGYITEPGYSSIFISIWFLSGIIITILGITGLYVGKCFEQSKNRPNYIINTKINL
ncbi:MAG: glycosyltransferase family 2 protein [Cytophagales bacterium]